MILTVTLNAAIDKRYVVEGAQIGEVNRVTECSYTPGGKGLNVSKCATIAGARVVATGFIGGHAGNYIIENLKLKEIETDFYHLATESRTCINIWDRLTKTQTEYLEPGFTVTQEQVEEFILKFKQQVQYADVVTLSGSAPKGISSDIYQRLIAIVKDAGKKVVLDTSGELLRLGIRSKPTMIKPNIDEIRLLTGKKCDTREELIDAARAIQKSGVERVVISLGKEGSLVVAESGTYVVTVPKIEAVNTVGCGDAMTAGYAIGLEQQFGIEEEIKYASALATAAALNEYTGFFRKEEMDAIRKNIKVQKIN